MNFYHYMPPFRKPRGRRRQIAEEFYLLNKYVNMK